MKTLALMTVTVLSIQRVAVELKDDWEDQSI